LLYYTLLVGVMSGWLLAVRRRAWTSAAIVLIGLSALARWNASRMDSTVTILPLSGGHSVFVNGAGAQNDWLVDCGSTNSVEFILKPFLRAQGVNQLHRLMLTHGDVRHVGGFEPIRAEFRVGQTITSPLRFRSAAYRQMVANLAGNPLAHKFVTRGDETGPWRVLHPAGEDEFSQADDGALVLLGTFHGVRVLLLSDLGRRGQETLLNRSADLRADVVVTGLPAQSEPICDALLEILRPKVIIVADAELPATERAKPALRERLESRQVPVLYTRTEGAVTITIQTKGWFLSTASGKSISFSSAEQQRRPRIK
jgi:competence protein ComEC